MEYFVKVQIKSKDDLPEKGEYFVCKNNERHDWWIYNPDWDTKLWMENIDWYLKPVEIPEISDEEIENRASDLADPSSKKDFSRGEWLGFKEGAKWGISELKKRMTK